MTLTILNREPVIRKIEVYDFEWIPGSLKMRLCGRYGPQGYKYYLTVDDFLNDTLTFSNRGKWFFAHAGGLADVQFILERVAEQGGYVVEASFSGSSAIIVKIKKDKHVWTFCDSYWLFRDSLKSIGDAIGMPKTGPANEINMTSKEMKEWYATVPLETLIPYNKNDCQILYYALTQFQELLLKEGSILQKTIASCGMTLFRSKFLKQPIRTNATVNAIAREAYHASRVEVFCKRCDNANYYDVNSSFPFSMTKPMPGELQYTHIGIPDRIIGNPEICYLVKANVTVYETHIPPIPYRNNGRIFFPMGTWTGWFTDVDFELLMSEGAKINKVYESLEFNTFMDLADYSQTIYKKRKDCNTKFEKILYKYLLNCVYGKMAERPEKQRMWINPPREMLEKLSHEKLISAKAGGIFLEDIILPLEHIHVPVSVRITALSRKLLYDLISTSFDRFYCDTDGFSTTDNFETSNELGGLKLEKRIIHGEFYAPKVYSLTVEDKDKEGRDIEKTIVHAKGFSLGKDESIAKERFQNLIEGKHIEVEHMARLRENLKKGLAPRETIIKKVFSNKVVPKRFFYPDGQSRPWSVDEIKKFSGDEK